MLHAVPPGVGIYAKDVENITGLKNRTARRFLQQVKEHSGTTDLKPLTVQDFCKVTSIPEDVVRACLVD